MRNLRNTLGVLLISAALIAPVAARADDQKRYYDKAHKEYHTWDSNEDRAYHQYLQEHHKTDHDFARASKKEQQNYWTWRRSHQDTDHRQDNH